MALALAAGAAFFAALAALLPADHRDATYSWPPRQLHSAQPAEAWYTPLLLARHEPESIAVRIPCALAPPLPDAPRPVVVLATARDAPAAGGLRVTQSGRGLAVSVGNTGVTHMLLPAQAPSPSCAFEFSASGGQWSLRGGPDSVAEDGTLSMPVVSGLFSSLDLERGGRPSVTVTTTVYGSRTTVAQTVLRVIAVLAALAALWLVAVATMPRRPSFAFVRRAAAQVGIVDGAVVAVLLVWWVIGPAYFDDGWIVATQTNFEHTGDLTSYFDSFGVTSSLQYWLFWLEHWLFASSHALLVLRIPALVCLLATWVLCRWIFGRIAPSAGRAARSALTCAFLTGALAWGMTVRPEPVVALLVTGVLACTVLFLERGTTAPLAIAVVLIALAVSAHPAGLLTLAPLVVAAPALLRWVRPRVATVATILLAGGALLAVLALLGSDLRHLSGNLASLRAFGVENAGWRDELTRYSLLSRDLYGPPLRRLWIVLALLSVFAYLLRRRDRERSTLDVSAAAVGVALLLLIATPAKLPWHFGTLIGLGAIALGAETIRLVDDAARRPGWHVRPFIVVGAAVVAAAWAWSPRKSWSDLDLRTLSWTLGVERHLTFAKAAAAVPILVLAGLALVELVRGRRAFAGAAWRAAAWSVPAVAVPLLVFTVAVLAADAHKTSSWTLTRQNFDTLEGNTGCGLADDSLVPARESMRPLPAAGRIPERAAWLPPPPAAGLPGFALTPEGSSRPARSPWFRVTPGQRIGFFLTGVPSASETVGLEWGRARGGNVTPVGGGQVAGDLGSDARPELGYWRFYGAGALPPAPEGADALRLAVETPDAGGAAIGLTVPVTYEDEPLDRMLERDRPALALPNLVTYVPCVRLPDLRRGVAEVPRSIVAFRDSTWPLGTGTSPFDEVTELYHFVRLPLSDSPDPPDDVAVYVVDTHLDGATPVPAVPSP